MKIGQVSHYDEFPDEIIFGVDTLSVPHDIQKKAREIDGENFNSQCFGLCVAYELDSKNFTLVTEEPSTGLEQNIFYIDNDGDKHWFHTELSQEFLEQVFALCSKSIEQKENVKKSSVREALSHAAEMSAMSRAASSGKGKEVDKGAR